MSLSRNTAANLVGRIWAAALGVVLIPFYVRVLGMESYALVGFCATMQSLFGLIDFGLGAAFSRELANLSAVEETEQEQRDLLTTFNVIYWILAAIVGVAVWFLAPSIATKWVHAGKLSVAAIVTCVRLMGLFIALQFPTGLYQGGLLGLQRQIEYNAILIGSATVRGLGVMIVLWFISPTIEAFFVWQVLIAVLAAFANWIVLDRAMVGHRGRGRFVRTWVGRLWGYAAGTAGNTIGIVVAQQSDKVILIKTLPLEQFGYYTLAGSVATLLWTLAHPVCVAAFPRFNQRVALGDEQGLAVEYDRANQLLATILVPVSAVLLFFSYDAIAVWTRKPAIAAATQHLVVLFVLGMTLVALVSVAMHVALSYGWFRLTLGFTWGTALLSLPSFWICSRWFGTIGAAAVWCAQNAAYLLLVPILHTRYLRGGGTIWARRAFFYPGAAAIAVAAAMRLLVGSLANPIAMLAVLGATWAMATAAVVLVEPAMREQSMRVVRRLGLAPKGVS
ncbi:MAG TPA: lipopolysaccharide biosynthesis protein [Thermoanaerobaculia bacterium]